jgi:NarL family two-component system response regulator LiaR
MTKQQKVRVLVVDDDANFVEAIKTSFEADQRLEVVGAASNGEEAVQQAAALQPEVVAMDIAMPVLDGIEATRIICRADARCRVVLFSGSMFQERSEGREVALDAGATGYVAKARAALDLADAVVAAARGEAVAHVS